MDWNDIAKRLERYYAGDLSLREEQELREAMRSPDLPEEWHPERDYILGTSELAAEVQLSDDFEKEFNNLIRADERTRNRRGLYWMGGIAASLTLMLSVVMWPATEPVKDQPSGMMRANDWEPAEKAVKETRKSLALLEDHLEGSRSAFRYLEALSAPEEVNHLKKIDQVKKELSK